MPKINIDELVEPIEVTVGGITYHVEDISRETAKKMETIGEETKGTSNVEPLIDIITEILGAKREDIAKLGMRKLLRLVTSVMGTINAEIEGKNVPEVAPTK